MTEQKQVVPLNQPQTTEEAIAFRLCWVEHRGNYAVLFIDCNLAPMQVSRRFGGFITDTPYTVSIGEANVLCGAIRRSIIEGIRQAQVKA